MNDEDNRSFDKDQFTRADAVTTAAGVLRRSAGMAHSVPGEVDDIITLARYILTGDVVQFGTSTFEITNYDGEVLNTYSGSDGL